MAVCIEIVYRSAATLREEHVKPRSSLSPICMSLPAQFKAVFTELPTRTSIDFIISDRWPSRMVTKGSPRKGSGIKFRPAECGAYKNGRVYFFKCGPQSNARKWTSTDGGSSHGIESIIAGHTRPHAHIQQPRTDKHRHARQRSTDVSHKHHVHHIPHPRPHVAILSTECDNTLEHTGRSSLLRSWQSSLRLRRSTVKVDIDKVQHKVTTHTELSRRRMVMPCPTQTAQCALALQAKTLYCPEQRVGYIWWKEPRRCRR